MDIVTVHVEVEINPTETEQKVRQAVENMFGPMNMQVKPQHKGSLLLAEAKGQEALTKLRNLLQREHIRAAARPVLLHGLETKSLSFSLNKQVAFAGHVSFSTEPTESSLGPIKVEIKSENPRQIIDYLTAY
jgi:predicted RNA binding protein with dsRBD fold (UPF0201 family)